MSTDNANTTSITINRLESHLQGMRATQERLQDARTALSGGMFDPPIDTPKPAQEAMYTLAQRLRANAQGRTGTMGDLVDAVQQVQQERVVQDIQDAMFRMDALRRYSANHAKARYESAAGTPPAPNERHRAQASSEASEVIDVQAKEVTPSTES